MAALQVMIIAMRILQKLVVSAELVGQALVPYYRQVMPTLLQRRVMPGKVQMSPDGPSAFQSMSHMKLTHPEGLEKFWSRP